ncbi:PH domain-containing protein [Marinicella meishanensis]|uniref:PH domain-containing protein n=1 Tax=Marinicella meishanensis TaxID=2873263 RepID=UPI001CBB356F|nr:PH domain-containing protein [Marinicella sp. NBU2979]
MQEVSPFLKKQFQANEEVNFVASISNKPMIAYVVITILQITFIESIGGTAKVLYIWMAPWVGYVIYSFIYFLSSELVITNERVLGKSGLISRKTVEIPISQGEGLVVDQSILGRIFNYGRISNSGTGTTRVSMIFLDDPFLIRKKILETKAHFESN